MGQATEFRYFHDRAFFMRSRQTGLVPLAGQIRGSGQRGNINPHRQKCCATRIYTATRDGLSERV
jgi:hypothetical protein